MNCKRGYFGIGIVASKTPENVGGLWRSAHAFGASMIFTVAFRPPRQPTDTSKAARSVPLMQWEDWDTFLAHRPAGCALVAVETDDGMQSRVPYRLPAFPHPERALYVLGAEDRGLDSRMLAACEHMVEIPSALCLNVATAGSIVLYDRIAKCSA
jgi:tRNA G18 (ribose-2'-O)-methylase SpoU